MSHQLSHSLPFVDNYILPLVGEARLDGAERAGLRKEEERDVGVVPEVREVRLEREETRGPIQVLVRREESRGCLHEL